MDALRSILVSALLALAAVSCGSAAPADPHETEVAPLPRAAVRREFLGGAFVTWAREMPIEVDQAIAGQPTNRPVVVWAGTDAEVFGRGERASRGDDASRGVPWAGRGTSAFSR